MVMMLAMKNGRSKAKPNRAAAPRAMAIAITASMIGINPATTPPNTKTSTTSATARPMLSPRCRPSSASRMKSFSSVAGPADVRLEAIGGVDAGDRLDHQLGVLADGGVVFTGHGHRQQRRPPVLRDRSLLGQVAADVADDVGAEGGDGGLQPRRTPDIRGR